ncbi:glucose-induced degradation protein 8 homolog [Corticium candelabrum]|uniref:glucose-induced degradation protein 8 homolog n=1 Tax=Corticium candelabrum TaxID=121492 RepID=UPI002E2583AF|nr:glucose-induced degradation protein 8 homolog [Corticium candelabrum]XP_062504394.1 glucose-induced degradation protein 8 homolog [Corticium candelabrum]
MDIARLFSSMSDAKEDNKGITKEDWMEELRKVRIQRSEMNRIVLDYLVTEGFKEAAEKFSQETGLKPAVDLDMLDDRIRVREAVQRGDIDEAIQLVNDYDQEILDTNPRLYFFLQQQKLIELIRESKFESAVEFAQTELSDIGEKNPEFLNELERTMALMAFEKPEESPFGDLLHVSQRQKVAGELNSAMLETQDQRTTSKLSNVLKLLLWSQSQLNERNVKYPMMTDIATATLTETQKK